MLRKSREFLQVPLVTCRITHAKNPVLSHIRFMNTNCDSVNSVKNKIYRDTVYISKMVRFKVLFVMNYILLTFKQVQIISCAATSDIIGSLIRPNISLRIKYRSVLLHYILRFIFHDLFRHSNFHNFSRKTQSLKSRRQGAI